MDENPNPRNLFPDLFDKTADPTNPSIANRGFRGVGCLVEPVGLNS